jgi:hypothetical protein
MTGMCHHVQLLVEMESPECFAQGGLKLRSSQSQPLKTAAGAQLQSIFLNDYNLLAWSEGSVLFFKIFVVLGGY